MAFALFVDGDVHGRHSGRLCLLLTPMVAMLVVVGGDGGGDGCDRGGDGCDREVVVVVVVLVLVMMVVVW